MAERFAVDADIETGVERNEAPCVTDIPVNVLVGAEATKAALSAWSELADAVRVEVAIEGEA